MLSIILPTYNEAGNIIPLIREIKEKLAKFPHEIIVVDDNSPDGTAILVKNFIFKNRDVCLIIRRNNKGLANSINEGICKCKGSYILIMDTDFNHDPSVITQFLKEIKNCDIVVGSRYIRGGGMENKLRYILSLSYNYLIRLVLQLPTTDNLSGFYVMRKEKLNLLPRNKIFIGYGDYFIRLLYHSSRMGFAVKEIPVFYKNRQAGYSKSKFIPMFLDYTKTVLKILWP